jgi:hypothetical protein
LSTQIDPLELETVETRDRGSASTAGQTNPTESNSMMVVRFIWLTLIGLSLVPVALLSFVLNPLVFWMLGPEAWRERVARLHPYRSWIGASLVVFGIATTVYGVRYG